MGERPFVVEDLTEIAGIDPHAALRASVKIRSFLWRWLVLVARHVVHGRKNPRANAQVSIARMPAAQSNASKTPRVERFQDDFTRDVGMRSRPARARSFAWQRLREIAASRKPKGHAGRFECNPDDALALQIDPSRAARMIGTRVHCRRQLEQEGFVRVANAPGSWMAW
jgi:hypothetical protein